MKFISITSPAANNLETYINCSEIAAIQELFIEGICYSKIILKSGIELTVEETASDIYATIQQAIPELEAAANL